MLQYLLPMLVGNILFPKAYHLIQESPEDRKDSEQHQYGESLLDVSDEPFVVLMLRRVQPMRVLVLLPP